MKMTQNEHAQKTCRNLYWLVLITVTLLRLAFAGSFGLGVDESHYVMYARHLDWGYIDHPPMVAFLAALAGGLGDSPIFVRLGPVLCSTLSLILLRYLALALYRDERIALGALVLLHLMPYQHLLMAALLPDATLNLFWCATLLAVWHAMKKGSWSGWILAGILFGGALLSKYHAVLLPVCLFCYMMMSPGHRHWLGKIKPYAALSIGMIIFLPNVIWNASNAWISYRFQLAHGTGGNFAVANILAVFGAQLGVWSPVIAGLFVVSIIELLRQKPLSDMDRYVIWTSTPVFVFFCGIGLFGKILPHWPAVAWWTGSLAVVVVVLRKISQTGTAEMRWKRWSAAAAAVGLFMIAVLFTGLFTPIVGPLYNQVRTMSERLHQKFPTIKPLGPYKPKFEITNELFGWNEIGPRVEEIRAQMPKPDHTFVFGHRPFTSSQVAVHLEPETVVTTLHRKTNQYRLWFSAPAHEGWDALFIDDDRYFKGPQRYRHLFSSVDPVPEIISVYRRGYLAREARVYKYFGFKGKYE